MTPLALMLFVVLIGLSFGGFAQIELDDQLRIRQNTLASLHPSRPVEYLHLAEELLLFENDDASGQLGVELLVRSVILGERNNQPSVASSACIVLAELAQNTRDRLWMWDLAYLLDPTREAEWIEAQKSRRETEADREASRCLFAIRYHQLPLGEELFGKPEVRERILLAGEDAGVRREDLVMLLQREIERGNVDACRGRLYIAERGAPGTRLACPDHLRGLGMLSNDEDLRVFLRVEMELNGVQLSSWGGAVSMSKVEALKLPSVQELVARMGVRSEEVFYRDGRWVATP